MLLNTQIIVLPFDYSDHSKESVRSVIERADKATSIHIIHVVPRTMTMISVDPAMPILPANDEDIRKQALEALGQMYGSIGNPKIELHCLIGDPGSAIAEQAKNFGADLIIMPSNGRTGLKRLFLGSVAERVLRMAHCPVLILRGDSNIFQP